MISAGVNLSMTVLGFAASVMFIIFVCTRLLCARLHRRSPMRPPELASPFQRDFARVERGINGMEPIVVATFPIIKYDCEVFASREDALCTVCLGEYEEKDLLRILPNCGHAFHINCIDIWLRQHSTCPVCRLCLQGSCNGQSVLSPFISIAAQPRYSSRATISEDLFEQPLNSNSGLQWRARVHGQEQPIASSENQYGNNHGETDRIASERHHTFYHDTDSNFGAEDFHSLQLNDAAKGHTQFLSQSLVDDIPRTHRLWQCKALENGCMAAGNSAEAQEREGSVSLQIDTTGIASCSQTQHGMNVENADQIYERSVYVEKSSTALCVASLSFDGVIPTNDYGGSDILGRNWMPSLIEDGRDTKERKVSCDGSPLAVHGVKNFELTSENRDSASKSLERNLGPASEEAVPRSMGGSLALSSADIRTKMIEQESSDGMPALNSFVNTEAKQTAGNRHLTIYSETDELEMNILSRKLNAERSQNACASQSLDGKDTYGGEGLNNR